MPRTRKLKTPIRLKDGRSLEMLRDAADLIIGLPERRQAKDHWQYTAHLLVKAQRPMATEIVVDTFTDQLSFALKMDGLI